jgi:hypothetical protein
VQDLDQKKQAFSARFGTKSLGFPPLRAAARPALGQRRRLGRGRAGLRAMNEILNQA